jgi:hypothetical protein
MELGMRSALFGLSEWYLISSAIALDGSLDF